MKNAVVSSSLQAFRRLTFDLSADNPVHLFHNTIDKRQDALSDMHYEPEVGIVLKGRMRREYEGWRADFNAGDVWLCGMWEPHGYRIMTEPCEVVVLVFLPEMFTAAVRTSIDWLEPFGCPPQQRPKVGAGDRSRVLRIAADLLESERLPGAQQTAWRVLLLQELLLMLRTGWSVPANETALNTQTYRRFEPAIRLVFETTRFVTVAEAAKRCGMGRNTFSTLFKTVTGISFAHFSLQYRLNAAARLLTAGSLPVKAVAKECGFTDVSHFHRCFSDYAGVSPARYRRQQIHL